MKKNPYTVVIHWRKFSWTLRAWAQQPSHLNGLLQHFGPQPSEMKVMPG